MKCVICKYKNAAAEARTHPNGTTVFIADALRKKTDGKTCDLHKDHSERGRAMTEADKNLELAKFGGYVPLENVWHKPVHVPKGDRQ